MFPMTMPAQMLNMQDMSGLEVGGMATTRLAEVANNVAKSDPHMYVELILRSEVRKMTRLREMRVVGDAHGLKGRPNVAKRGR